MFFSLNGDVYLLVLLIFRANQVQVTIFEVIFYAAIHENTNPTTSRDISKSHSIR